MQIRNLLSESWSTDDRAVSPVLGVILMVAVALVLATFVGSFLLGVASNSDATPHAAMDFGYDSDATSYSGPSTGAGNCRANIAGNPTEGEVAVTVAASDPIKAEKLEIVGHQGSNRVDFAACSPDVAPGDIVRPGDNAYVGVTPGDTFRVVWTNDAGDASNSLARWTAPNT